MKKKIIFIIILLIPLAIALDSNPNIPKITSPIQNIISQAFNSTYNNLLNQQCPSGKVVNGTLANGTITCITDQTGGGLTGTNIFFKNESNIVTQSTYLNNLTFGIVSPFTTIVRGNNVANITLTLPNATSVLMSMASVDTITGRKTFADGTILMKDSNAGTGIAGLHYLDNTGSISPSITFQDLGGDWTVAAVDRVNTWFATNGLQLFQKGIVLFGGSNGKYYITNNNDTFAGIKGFDLGSPTQNVTFAYLEDNKNASAWSGYAMCYTTNGGFGHCTNAVNATGGCSCVGN